jgi:general secretion pathway protein K
LNTQRAQRGIALLTAIVLVALATVLAVAIGFNTAMTARRATGSFAVEQGLQFALGAEALAAYALKEDLRQAAPRTAGAGGTPPPPAAQTDTPADEWTRPFGPVEVASGVSLEALLSDEQGKFNLNALIDATGKADPEAVEIFTRLLQLLELEPKWAGMTVDWLDENPDVQSGSGEDDLYTAQQPGYRAANGLITSPSELMQLPGFDRERYLRLLPYVTALPPVSRAVNICFAAPPVLDALVSAFSPSVQKGYMNEDPKRFTEQRTAGCYPGKTALTNSVDAAAQQKFAPWITDQSSYFRLHTWISIGTTRFALYSLLERQNQQVRTLLRTFGTE